MVRFGVQRRAIDEGGLPYPPHMTGKRSRPEYDVPRIHGHGNGTQGATSSFDIPRIHDIPRPFNGSGLQGATSAYGMQSFAPQSQLGRHADLHIDPRYEHHDDSGRYQRNMHVHEDHHRQSLAQQSSHVAAGERARMTGILPTPNASSTLFVEGFPAAFTRREASHIFRPFSGFLDLRLIVKESRRPGSEPLVLCFVEFVTSAHATIAMRALQGYMVDIYDDSSARLSVEYSHSSQSLGGRLRGDH